jgi:hypothetical protein
MPREIILPRPTFSFPDRVFARLNRTVIQYAVFEHLRMLRALVPVAICKESEEPVRTVGGAAGVPGGVSCFDVVTRNLLFLV